MYHNFPSWLEAKLYKKVRPQINRLNQPINVTNQVVKPLQISLCNQQAQAIFELLIMTPLMTKVSINQIED